MMSIAITLMVWIAAIVVMGDILCSVKRNV